jgi:hypothetical protein
MKTPNLILLTHAGPPWVIVLQQRNRNDMLLQRLSRKRAECGIETQEER